MAEFALPKNSRISGKGREHKAPAGAGRVKSFKIYRYDPDSGENPRYDRFEIDLDDTGPMILDASSRSRTRSIRRSPSAAPAARAFAAPAR
jgi:succinate dehydrogenase / fumarate reductase iron-sulfur subunit